jgi:RimJ/RimL family protein N-acetyltransferase
MSWIKHPTTLIGLNIELVPLEENHFDEICLLGNVEAIWEYSPTGVYGFDQNMHLRFLEDCLLKRDLGQYYPFVIVQKETKRVIGFTTFHSIKPDNKSLEIGCTWFHPDYWGTGVNGESKFLMLKFCFEKLKTIRVQIKASDNNIRSRKAIEKMGAKFEGVLRKDKILEDGTMRNAAYYSIIDDEWELVKSNFKRFDLE